MNKIVVVLSLVFSVLCFGNNNSNSDIGKSDSTLNQIYKFYKADVGNHLLNETCLVDPKNVVSYVINHA